MGVQALWGGLGVLTGMAHGVALWRAAGAASLPGPLMLLRMLTVGAILVVAAVMGGLLPAAAGWAGGLAAAGTVVSARSARWIR